MAQSPTSRGTRKLSDVARHVVVPKGIVSTGYPAVQAKCRDLGIVHDDWQQGLGRLILGKRADGKYAATVGGIVLSIPRQVGKTFTVGSIIVALCLLYPGTTVLWTAHRTRTSNETFAAMKGMTSRRKIKPLMFEPRSTNGEQEIRFRNGSRILFGAREQGFGRGFAQVDIEVFDEAQILTESALEDMVAATNQARHPHGALLFYMGTPPRPKDPGEAFRNKRAKALAGKTKDQVYVELSADKNAKPDDRRQWAKGNPSYPDRTPPESMMRLRENVGSDESFLREGLGIWDEVATTTALIRPSQWKALHVQIGPSEGPVAYGVKFSSDGSRVALAAARRGATDGKVHVEVVRVSSMSAGNGWLVDWLATRWRTCALIVIDGKSGAGPLVNALRERGVPARRILTPSLDQVIAAHSGLLEAVAAKTLTHYGQTGLNDVVKAATKRPIGKAGGWGWQPIGDDVDVTPLEAATYAHFGAATTKRKSTGSDQGRKVVVLS